MQVTQLWIHPAKSMLGRRVDRVDLDEIGVVGDRLWAVRDLERGGIVGAKKIAGLMELEARAEGEDLAIDLPDGTTVRASDADVDDRLSAALDRPVRLERRAPAADADHFRRGAPDSDDLVEELRGIFGRTDDEPLPDLSVFPPELLEFEAVPGTYYDAFPLLVLSEQTLAGLQQALPDAVVDVRRFRPSVVLDTGGEPGHPEIEWAGRTARLGGAEIEFTVACPRCVMITRAVADDVPADRSILRHVVAEMDQNVGVYAAVRRGGSVAVGDRLELD